MARYNQGESQYMSFPDPRYPVTFREAPFYNDVYYYRRDFHDQHPVDPSYGGREAPFYNDVYYRRHFHDQRHPVDPSYGGREAPFYNDVYYRRDFRDQHPVDPSHGGHLIPNYEQVFLRQEDPWWHNVNHEFPHGGYGYPVYIPEHQYPTEAVECTVTLFAPQLCCDNCEHRVVEALKNFPGVRDVGTDQWEKKVVVVGENLQPEQVLRRLQRVSHMNRSVFWQDR